MITFLFYIIFTYLLASIPNALIIGKYFKGIDLREKGSGNLGATNAQRILGTKLGLMVLILDILKGFIPLYIAMKYLFVDDYIKISILGLVAVLGHSYSIFLKFGGGKSVAIMIGVYLAIFPKVLLLGLITFLITIYLTNYVAIASISMSILTPVYVYILEKNIYYTILAILISILIVYRHKINIKRLINGEESKFKGSK